MIELCVKCGYCCSKGPCSYSKWDRDKCAFLVEEDPEKGTFICLIYEEIKEKEKEKDSRYPMFDCGCSSSMFNNIRNAVIKKMNND